MTNNINEIAIIKDMHYYYMDILLAFIWVIINFTIGFSLKICIILGLIIIKIRNRYYIKSEKIILIKDVGIILKIIYYNGYEIEKVLKLDNIIECFIFEHIGGIIVKNRIAILSNNNKIKLLTKNNIKLEKMIVIRNKINAFLMGSK